MKCQPTACILKSLLVMVSNVRQFLAQITERTSGIIPTLPGLFWSFGTSVWDVSRADVSAGSVLLLVGGCRQIVPGGCTGTICLHPTICLARPGDVILHQREVTLHVGYS